jgi:hypothetical protein
MRPTFRCKENDSLSRWAFPGRADVRPGAPSQCGTAVEPAYGLLCRSAGDIRPPGETGPDAAAIVWAATVAHSSRWAQEGEHATY